jgi:exodeoxyribonuclease V beta subunit
VTLTVPVTHPGEEERQRFAVIDYKSNRLAPAGEPLTAWQHRPAALAREMLPDPYGRAT